VTEVSENILEEFTAKIPSRNMTSLNKAFAKVEKKAKALGVGVPTMEVSDLIRRKRQDGAYREYHEVTIRGELPKIDGWTLMARIDHTQARNIIVQTGLTDRLVEEKWRDAGPDCDHCEHQRKRNDTFILCNEEGEWKQVGRNCLADFAGSTNPARWLVLFMGLRDSVGALEEDDYSGYSKADPFIDTIAYLENVSVLVTEHGWYSRSAWRENGHTGICTADRALHNMFPHRPEDALPINEENGLEAKAAIAWVRELQSKKRLNDYEYNLLAVTDDDCFNAMRYTGIVASIIMAYRRDKGIDERGTKKEIVSVHQGELKERMDLTLTITKRIDMEVNSYSGYGFDMLRIHIMEDEAGNVYTWKTTSEHLEEEWTYQMRGTVKEHTEYRGTPQTVLTRCKVSEHVQEAEECQCWHCQQLEEKNNGKV